MFRFRTPPPLIARIHILKSDVPHWDYLQSTMVRPPASPACLICQRRPGDGLYDSAMCHATHSQATRKKKIPRFPKNPISPQEVLTIPLAMRIFSHGRISRGRVRHGSIRVDTLDRGDSPVPLAVPGVEQGRVAGLRLVEPENRASSPLHDLLGQPLRLLFGQLVAG